MMSIFQIIISQLTTYLKKRVNICDYTVMMPEMWQERHNTDANQDPTSGSLFWLLENFMYEGFAYLYESMPWAHGHRRPEEGIWSPGTEIPGMTWMEFLKVTWLTKLAN